MAFGWVSRYLCCSDQTPHSAKIFPVEEPEAPIPLFHEVVSSDEIDSICQHIAITFPHGTSETIQAFISAHGGRLFYEAAHNETGISLASKKDTDLPMSIRCKVGRESTLNELQIPLREIRRGGFKVIKEVRRITQAGAIVAAQAGFLKSVQGKLKGNELEKGVMISTEFRSCGVPNILPMEMCTYKGHDGSIKQKILMELCSKDFLVLLKAIWKKGDSDKDRPESTKIDQLLKIAYEVACSLQGIHELNWCYLDLKPENILLRNRHCPLITDFDFSVPEGQRVKSVGTMGFMAPELMFARSQEAATKACDMWSFGALLLAITMGWNPFQNLHEEIQVKAKKTKVSEVQFKQWVEQNNDLIFKVCRFLQKLNDPLMPFIAKLLCLNPKERPSASDAVAVLQDLPPLPDDLPFVNVLLKTELQSR